MRITHSTPAIVSPQHSTEPGRSSVTSLTRTREPLEDAIETLRYSLEKLSPRRTYSISLQDNMTRYVDQRKHFNNAVALDWLSGTSYADKHRFELAALPGGDIPAAQYGLSITKEHSIAENFAPRLRLTHEGSGGYHRMTPSASLDDKCKALYEAKCGKLAPGLDVIFVNSKSAAKKISSDITTGSSFEQPYKVNSALSIFGARLRMQNNILRRAKSYTEVHPGILAVTFDSLHSKEEMEDRLIQIGARVSPYLIERALRNEKSATGAISSVDNIVSLKQFSKAIVGSIAELADLPEQHPASAQAGVIVALVTDLKSVLESGETLRQHRNDPILHNALCVLRDQLETLATQQHDNMSFSNAYMAIMEEMKIILSAVRPYDKAAYKAAATQQLLSQLDLATQAQLSSLHISAFMTTSGINSIDEGLAAARALIGNKDIDILRDSTGRESPVYFEVPGLIEHNGLLIKAGASTIYATLNPNTLAQGDWGGGKAIANALRSRLSNRGSKHPVALVLDRTVERREDMSELLKNLAPMIASGHLCILLCKSHQKFSSMGSAKVAAGNLMLIASRDQANAKVIGLLEKNEHGLEWMAADERQLMTHFLRSGQQEYALFNKAVANANFLREHCFSGPEHANLVNFPHCFPFYNYTRTQAKPPEENGLRSGLNRRIRERAKSL